MSWSERAWDFIQFLAVIALAIVCLSMLGRSGANIINHLRKK